ncbi:Regulator of telomere elongation helicase 1-like protein [Armadillidium nasatum]|uniref:Regulator of telomere elongation helicase 1 homolog n=1 Tax=Armadillidium nasatum TaxID=96803 RepID=A0A5N5SLD2_9CRUS|nr:Regulator of telomere elongation helicase 1-like protein [Armadillidium nasatum]
MPEILLNNVPVRFPFEPYEVQKNYMQKLLECLQEGKNGVLESPTGTGKTLCLLCASLAWLEMKKAEHRAKVLASNLSEDSDNKLLSSISSQLKAAVGGMWKQGNGIPKIIYSSRTHSQLSQAISELKRTTYKHMKMSVLGSRDQLCIHPEVSKETNNNNKVQMCQVRVKGRNCYFYNQVETKRVDPDVINSVLDIEDLVKLGKKRTFCPYYMAREIRQDADIIFLPYNYLLDPKSRSAHNIDLQGNIVIFDEAHNVEKMCEESASLQLRSTDLALCIDDVTHVMEKLQELSESNLGSSENALIPEDFSPEDLYILKTIFLELEKAVDEISLPADGTGVTYPGSYMFDLLQKAEITPNKKYIIVDLLEKLIQYLTMNSTSPFQRKGSGLQKFSALIKTVYSKENFSVSYMELVKQCYKVHITAEEKKKPQAKDGWNAPKITPINAKTGKVISYWCFNPGFGGTLSPLESFTSELKIPFPIKLENPHVIKPCQVWVGTICKGPDGTILNSSFKNRDKPEYLNSLGSTILNFSRIVPGGLLVFFPSYPQLRKCQEFWQGNGIWSSITNSMAIFVEPQTKDGFITAMDGFYEKVRDPNLKGACFLAVCRGKVSEGLDFANRNGRAVIITGLPYPPFKDPRVVLKQKYLDEVRSKSKTGLSGANWYRLEASRAVNQAIGRVIRHRNDYGAIILCDKRFTEFGFQNELSSWIRPYMKTHEAFGLVLREIIQFFRVAKSMFPEPDNIDKGPRTSGSSIKIEYEDSKSLPGSSAPVAAHAFQQPTSTRSFTSSFVKKEPPKHPAFNEFMTAVYKPQKSVLGEENASSDATPKNIFAALEKRSSSVLDFNSCQTNEASTSTKSSNENSIPKRKKIKLISQSEKSLNSFLKKEETSSSCLSNSSSLNQASSNVAQCSTGESSECSKNELDDLKRKKITSYLKEVKSHLSGEEYSVFSEGIKHYKRYKDVDSIIATLLTLFGKKRERRILLLKFTLFLQPDHRHQLEAVFHDIVNL